MTAAIFNAVGRGYSARNILGAIGRRAPQYANTINTAYYAGYTADQILSRISSMRDGKNYSPDQFMTEHEKTLRNHERNKKYATMQAIGMAGTAGAVGAGIAQLYSYLQKQKALHPDEIIIPNKRYLRDKGKSNPHTIHQDRLQIGHDKKQIPYKEGDEKKSIAPPNLLVEGSSSNNRKADRPPSPPPFKNVPPVVFNKNYPGQNDPVPPPQTENAVKPYMKSVKVLEGLGEANRIMNMIEGGMTNDEMKLVLPMMMKKEAYNIISKGEEMDRLLNDMQEYVKENPREKKDFLNSGFDIQPSVEMQSQQEQPIQNQMQPPQSQPQMQPMQQQDQQINPIMSPQFNEPINEIQSQLNNQNESVEPERPSRMVQTNTGESGDLIDVKNGVATINVNGKEKKFKFSDLETSPQNVEDALRFVMNSIPEAKKSTALMGTVHIPGINMMITKFYSGGSVWYKDVPLERYNKIVFSTKAPKGTKRTGIAEYSPNSADSRGSEFSDFKRDPMYSKANEGKTWGYIPDKYSLFDHVQHMIDKISKEEYDDAGNLITPKPRVKKEPAKPKADKPVSSPKSMIEDRKIASDEAKKQKEIEKYEKKLNDKSKYQDPRNIEHYEDQIIKLKGEKIDLKKPLGFLSKSALREIFSSRNTMVQDVIEDYNPQNISEFYKYIEELPAGSKDKKQEAIDLIKSILKEKGYQGV